MSRATDLNFRNPKEITDAIYNPDKTYTGTVLQFKTNHVSAEKISKMLPFRSSDIRLPAYRLNERRMSPFVGPSNYHHHQQFLKINKSPCLAKFRPEVNQGSDCFNMIGHSRVYIPAFEKHRERRNLIEQTKDLGYRPRAPMYPASCSTLRTNESMSRRDMKSFSKKPQQTDQSKHDQLKQTSLSEQIIEDETLPHDQDDAAAAQKEAQPVQDDSSTHGQFVPLASQSPRQEGPLVKRHQTEKRLIENGSTSHTQSQDKYKDIQPVLQEKCLASLQQRAIQSQQRSRAVRGSSNLRPLKNQLQDQDGNIASLTSMSQKRQRMTVQDRQSASAMAFKHQHRHSMNLINREPAKDVVRNSQQEPTPYITMARNSSAANFTIRGQNEELGTKQVSIDNEAADNSKPPLSQNTACKDATSQNQITQADTQLGASQGQMKVSVVSTSQNISQMNQVHSSAKSMSRPQTAKYRSGQGLAPDSADKGSHNRQHPNAQNLIATGVGRVNSAKELPMKVVGKKSLRSGRTQTGVSNILSHGGSAFSYQLKTPGAAVNNALPECTDASQVSFRGVAYIDGQSHSFSLAQAAQAAKATKNPQRHASRSKSRKRARQATFQGGTKQDMILDQALKDRIKALKATTKISHRVGTVGSASNSPIRSRQNMIRALESDNVDSVPLPDNYESNMADPLVKVSRAPLSTANIRSKSTHRRLAQRDSQRVVKSIGLLQAYGEFDRFMKMSKKHLKDAKREARLREREQKEFYDRVQPTHGQAYQQEVQSQENMKLYHDIQQTIRGGASRKKQRPPKGSSTRHMQVVKIAQANHTDGSLVQPADNDLMRTSGRLNEDESQPIEEYLQASAGSQYKQRVVDGGDVAEV